MSPKTKVVSPVRKCWHKKLSMCEEIIYLQNDNKDESSYDDSKDNKKINVQYVFVIILCIPFIVFLWLY